MAPTPSEEPNQFVPGGMNRRGRRAQREFNERAERLGELHRELEELAQEAPFPEGDDRGNRMEELAGQIWFLEQRNLERLFPDSPDEPPPPPLPNFNVLPIGLNVPQPPIAFREVAGTAIPQAGPSPVALPEQPTPSPPPLPPPQFVYPPPVNRTTSLPEVDMHSAFPPAPPPAPGAPPVMHSSMPGQEINYHPPGEGGPLVARPVPPPIPVNQGSVAGPSNQLPTSSPFGRANYNPPSPPPTTINVNNATPPPPPPPPTASFAGSDINVASMLQIAGGMMRGGQLPVDERGVLMPPRDSRPNWTQGGPVGPRGGGSGIGMMGGGGGGRGGGGGMGGEGGLDMGSKLQIAGRAMTGDVGAIAQIITHQVEEFKRNLSNSFKEAGKAFNSERAGETAGHAGGSVESYGKALNALGTGTGTIFEYGGKAVRIIGEALDSLQKWNNALHESNMRFSNWSGAMASVRAQQEVRDIELERTRGDRRAASADYLAEAKSRLATETSPVEDSIANMKNWLAGFLSNKVADLLDPVNKILAKMGYVDDKGPLGDGEGLAEWMDRVARDDNKERGRPRRFFSDVEEGRR